ncbi:hypothetical protein HELRODRAFT_178768 [Helobdella robusta]|uniref:Uncharacterized protein n=1 Tax=Helobdella robusta TaxID=6412 RepID=T1FDP7_HELRO|nr:hypothetical protein HELRODRAFT_178768 [Helobdella robusta]ESN96964.1 hypothetical protein HELRODRAFT_178768 [Helobdella robusta]
MTKRLLWTSYVNIDTSDKFKKYEGALPSMDFLPVCIEVLGPMDNNTSIFFKKICKMISGRSGDSRELFFAMNHISCLLQSTLFDLSAKILAIKLILSTMDVFYSLQADSQASILVLKEPSGISAHYGRRPDGCTLIPWRAGRCLAWDVTVSGTLAERYVNLTSKECGLAAVRAADEKMKKYGNALPSMEFLPICIEVLGPMDPNTLKFLKAICKMISVRSGDSRELFFATNHISCLLQRFLCVCVLENIQLNADMCN